MNYTCVRCKQRPAVLFTTRIEGDKSISEGYCLSCAKDIGIPQVRHMIEKMGITDEDIETLNSQLMEMFEGSEDGFVPGGAMPFPTMMQNFFAGQMRPAPADDEPPDLPAAAPDRPQAAPARERAPRESGKKRKHLDAYCENLTLKAAKGEIDNIIGRENEIYRVIQILNRRTKNNPCLIGEPGVGKTAIAEGIAQRLAEGRMPPSLADKELYMLDLTALVAGTQFRGQFESRVKGLVEDIKSAGNVILFIDEVHNLIGAGDAEGSMNAANILKPALSRGEIQVIGATTFNEYRKHIEKDAALERRFQPVKVGEPSIEDTIEVLRGVKKYYEEYHNVTVSDAIVEKAVAMSERYITDRFLPDKAIDLLDEACSCCTLDNPDIGRYNQLKKDIEDLRSEERNLSEQEIVDYEHLAKVRYQIIKAEEAMAALEPGATGRPVTEEHLAKVVELWTGIPASKIKESEMARVAGLADALKKHIIGQDEAVDLVAAAVRRTRVQLSARRRPASFIFVGPTGVGKTELVKRLSAELFNDADPLIRLDMSEFMEKHSVSRIVGSPPGYVGYDEAGQLTEKVRRRPYSVVLFDEIEKAHPDVMNILLQILDEGRITDAQGRVVSFENTIIVMTSNAGSNEKTTALGFNKKPSEVEKDKVQKALAAFLRPEFLARVDEIVVFRALDAEDFGRIAALMLDELVPILADKGIKFAYTEEVTDYIAQKAHGQKSGARDIRKLIRKEVEDPLSLLLLSHPEAPPALIKAVMEEGAIKILTA
jgi:ATP-dependent Clp protease ATP-binding subunit ClpC